MTIEGIISAHEFFREAWTNHFDMERRILFKLFQSRNGELVMDGRIGDPSTKEMSSQEIVTAAITCCSALRKLLDRIIDRFKKEELNIRTEKNNYFNLLRNDPSVTKEALQKNLETNLGIDMADHYPKLFENLLKLQLRSHSEAQFWNDFIKLVNLDKHTNTERAKLLELVSNPVALARECSDKVEEICNYFLETIEESKSLKRRVDKLISGIKGGEQGSARVLVGVLKDNPDFVVRMGSTCRLLKMMALIDNLGSPNQETTDAYLTVVRGKFTSSHALRCSHLDMETSLLSTDIMKKCKDTCSEAKKMLDGALSSVKDKLLRAGRNSPEPDAATEPVSFPLPDLDLKTVIPASWKKKVKKKLKTDLDDMGITNGPSKDKLLDILLKAQPCSSDDNYKFKAMFNFIKNGEPDDNGKVHITTYSGEDKGYDVLELTRWCTDNSERIAMQLDDLCRNIDNA